MCTAKIIAVCMDKTLNNVSAADAEKKVSDIQFFGDGDTWQLICKASSKNEGWMKSTKAMEIEGVGCVVQVTTQQGGEICEALTFVPGVCIHLVAGDDGETLVGRKLVAF